MQFLWTISLPVSSVRVCVHLYAVSLNYIFQSYLTMALVLSIGNVSSLSVLQYMTCTNSRLSVETWRKKLNHAQLGSRGITCIHLFAFPHLNTDPNNTHTTKRITLKCTHRYTHTRAHTRTHTYTDLHKLNTITHSNTYILTLIHIFSRIMAIYLTGGMARLTRNMEVVGSSPITGPLCFLEQNTLPLLLSTYWLVPGTDSSVISQSN